MPKPAETKIHLTTINKQCAWIWLIEKIEISFVAAVQPPTRSPLTLFSPPGPLDSSSVAGGSGWAQTMRMSRDHGVVIVPIC